MSFSIFQLYAFYCLLLLCSCSSKEDHRSILYQSFNAELENMSWVIRISSDELLRKLDSKRSEPATHYRAELWYAKAEMIHKLTDTAIIYIKNLEKELNISNAFSENGNEDSQSDNKKASKILSVKRQTLYNYLVAYKNAVLKVDTLIKQEFEMNLFLTSAEYEKEEQNNEGLINYFFDDISDKEAFLLLHHLENNLRFIENKMILFCGEQVGSTDGWSMFNQFSTIIGQSSTVIKKGETLEITAGVGSFSKAVAPEITINGKRIEIGEDGAAHHKLLQNSIPGKKTVQVKIEYTDQEGNKRLVVRPVKYVVID